MGQVEGVSGHHHALGHRGRKAFANQLADELESEAMREQPTVSTAVRIVGQHPEQAAVLTIHRFPHARYSRCLGHIERAACPKLLLPVN
jgi:hypothetical protein